MIDHGLNETSREIPTYPHRRDLLDVVAESLAHKNGSSFWGVEVNDARLERPAKYRFTEHAERNAIYHAAQQGNATLGTTLYVPWYACADCGRAIIQAGIKRVVGHDCYRQWYESDGEELNDPNRMSWDDSIADAVTMMQEAGVEMVHVTDNLNMGIKIRYNGVERDI